MQNKTKKIGEIFSDYNTSSNIKYANINCLNIIKNKNILQVEIYYDEYIEIKEIWYFEKFLKERFKFEQVDIKIKYHEQVQKKGIKEEWRNIIAYMAHKYPLTKPMLLLKSDIEEEEDKILIKMHIKGAEFLKAKKTDKELQKVIKNLFGKEYIIEINEELSLNDIKELKEARRKEEEQIIALVEKENEELRNKKQEEIEYNDTEYRPPIEVEGYIPENNEEKIEQLEQNKEYILGKPSKAKEKYIKIKEITANERKSDIGRKNCV